MNPTFTQSQLATFFYTTLNEKYEKILDVCYKLNNYEYLEPYLEQIGRNLNADISLIHKIFYERNPSFPSVLSIKEMIELNRVHMSKVITKEDIDVISNSKNEIITSMTLIIKNYEEVIPKLIDSSNQYEKVILELKGELHKKKLQISALDANVYYCPSIKSPLQIIDSDMSSPRGFTLDSSKELKSFSPVDFWSEPSLTF